MQDLTNEDYGSCKYDEFVLEKRDVFPENCSFVKNKNKNVYT